MKVIANRAELLTLCKRAARLANDASPVEELRGILLEANADAGQITYQPRIWRFPSEAK